MGILEDLLGTLLDRGGRSDRRLRRLIEEGQRTTARVEGLHIVSKSETADDHTWRLAVRAPMGEFVTGVRQRLIPREDLVALGTELDVIHHDGHVAIDWPASIERMTGAPDPRASLVPGKSKTDPPAPGIVDERLDRKRLEQGERTTGRVVTATPMVLMGVATQNQNITLLLADGRQVEVKRALVPFYAVRLLYEGAGLPVAVDRKNPNKVSIDWPAAAAGS